MESKFISPPLPGFLHELKKHFIGDLRFESAARILYSTDASMYQIEPLGVAIPKTQDDLQSVVELAAKYKSRSFRAARVHLLADRLSVKH